MPGGTLGVAGQDPRARAHFQAWGFINDVWPYLDPVFSERWSEGLLSEGLFEEISLPSYRLDKSEIQ